MRARAGKVSLPPVLMVDSAIGSPNRISLNWPDNQSGAATGSTAASWETIARRSLLMAQGACTGEWVRRRRPQCDPRWPPL